MTREFPILDPSSARQSILRRQPWDAFNVPEEMLDDNERIFGTRIGPDEGVRRILADVRERGDAAVREWTEKLDGVRVEDLRVSPDTILRSSAEIERDVL